MNNQFDAKRIPKFIYLLLGTIIAIVLFMIFVGYPLMRDAGNMQQAHTQVLKEIRDYDQAIKMRDSIEAEIKKNQAEFEQKEKELFIDRKESSKDIERYCRENNIILQNYSLGGAGDDEKCRVSTGGYPVKKVPITVTYKDTYAKTINFLKYLEEGSKGCYYVESCGMEQVGDSGEMFNVSMAITLYYYDMSEAIVATEPPTEATTEK